MARIGGDAPVLLRDFARQCCRDDDLLHATAPAHLTALPQCEAHRLTVVDLACKERSAAFYSGDQRARQSVEVKFGDFLDYVAAASRGDSHWLGEVDGLTFYLCQCPIAVFRPDETCSAPVLPTIMELFQVPETLSAVSVSQVNLWMSVEATSTSIHYDAYRNVLVVLHGKKTVKLYPPSQTKHLYARPIYSSSSNHSQVNYVNPDLARHPDFAQAQPIVVTASAGDAIYIPEGWWHQVDSDPFTVAINYWFEGVRETLVKSPNMSVYYARVVMGELVKVETQRAIEEIRSRHRLGVSESVSASAVALETRTQAEREARVLALSETAMKDMQVEMASLFPVEWQALLASASDEFAAVLVDFWDRSQEEDASWIVGVFEPLGDQADEIRHQLLEKCERFKREVYGRVVASTLGNLTG